MPLNTSWPTFAALQHKLDRLRNPDVAPLLTLLENTIEADNRRGVLAGTDGDDKPMPLTWRQQNEESVWVTKVLPDGRVVRFKMLGWKEGGKGPALAPHGESSRTVQSLRTAFFMDGPGEWVVVGAWENVLSKTGVPFLPFHFRGEGKLPRRDLAGLRPAGYREAVESVDVWAEAMASE